MGLIPDKVKLALYRDLTLADFPQRLAELRGDRLICKLQDPLGYRDFSTDFLSFVDAARFVDKVSVALRDMGVKRGERVGVNTSNNVDLPLMVFGIARAGAVAVPMNYMLKAKEMRYILENCGAETLIVDREVFDMNVGSREELPSIRRWITAGPAADRIEGTISLDDAMHEAAEGVAPARLHPDDPVAIFYTSGTTGFPKGATMSSRNLLTAQKIAAAIIPVGAREYGVFCLPAAHVMGFGCFILGSCVGLQAYWMRHFDPGAVLEAIQREKASVFVGVPAMYTMMLAHGIEPYDLSSMKMFGSAADAMPPELMEAFRKKGSLKVGPFSTEAFFVEVYGMVELAGVATLKIAIMGLNFPPGCVGWPVWPVRARILDEEGRSLPAGEVGEVAVYGPGVTKGYWGNTEATQELIQGGWLRTGDVGRKDKLGRLFFVDRKKDVIKVGGYSVFSVEVESEVLEHPDVSDVAVVGIPHPLKKQVPLAVVTLKPGSEATEEEILSWCEEHIAGYKKPRAVRILRPEEMPYGMTLKIRKLELRERFSDLFTAEAKG